MEKIDMSYDKEKAEIQANKYNNEKGRNQDGSDKDFGCNDKMLVCPECGLTPCRQSKKHISEWECCYCGEEVFDLEDEIDSDDDLEVKISELEWKDLIVGEDDE